MTGATMTDIRRNKFFRTPVYDRHIRHPEQSPFFIARDKKTMLCGLAKVSGLANKPVSSVSDELAVIIERHIKKGGPGQFTLAGLIKIEVKRKPATKARKGNNPFTGQETVFKAKPARDVVKIRPLKRRK
jgi:nucleoid DNA-binding protein